MLSAAGLMPLYVMTIDFTYNDVVLSIFDIAV